MQELIGKAHSFAHPQIGCKNKISRTSHVCVFVCMIDHSVIVALMACLFSFKKKNKVFLRFERKKTNRSR